MTVDILSHRGKKRAATIEIANDETGTREVGNYDVECGPRRARVEGFRREDRDALDLLEEALRALKETR